MKATLVVMAALGLLVAFRLGGPVDGAPYTKYHFRGAPLTYEDVGQLLRTLQVCCVVVAAASSLGSVTVTRQRAVALTSLGVALIAMQVAVLAPFYVSESLTSVRPHHLLPFAILVVLPSVSRTFAQSKGAPSR